MYCHECGTLLDNNSLYCDECGVFVGEAKSAHVANDAETPRALGFLLTHIGRLSAVLGCDTDMVADLLNSYVAARALDHVYYTIIDLGVYEPEPVHWHEVIRILRMARSGHSQMQASDSVPFLFIVGGSDVVDMPCVPHPLGEHAHGEETDVETDLLYAFGENAYSMRALLTGQLLRSPRQFLVGRLPVSAGTSLDDIERYMMRVANEPVIIFNEAYAQCDPNWKEVSAIVSTDLVHYSLFPTYKQTLPSNIYHRNIFLTPDIVQQNIGHVFNRDAQLYYFNMHGADASDFSGFYGASDTTPASMYQGISPFEIAQPESSNIIVTEACYGARFTGYQRSQSMLLSAIYSQTSLYLGSSRVAYGAADNMRQSPSDPYPLSNADIIAGAFISYLMQSYCGGVALHLAQCALVRESGFGPYELTTLAEFNLFGDPTLSAVVDSHSAHAVSAVTGEQARKTMPEGLLSANKECSDITVQPAGDSESASRPVSLLQRVRASVDANLDDIRKQVASKLYDVWGIEPRHMRSAARLSNSDGSKALSLSFKLPNAPQQEQMETCLDVITDLSGKVLKMHVTH